MKKKRNGRTLLLASAAVVTVSALSYFAAGLAVAYHMRSATRHHPYDVYPENYGLTRHDVSFASEDGVELVGWFIRSEEPNGPYGDAAVLIVHGHHGSMGRSWKVQLDDGSVIESNEFEKGVVALHRAGFNVLLFDLRNRGRSADAPPVSLGLHESLDVTAAVHWLASQPGVNPNRIGVKGSSMRGQGVANRDTCSTMHELLGGRFPPEGGVVPLGAANPSGFDTNPQSPDGPFPRGSAALATDVRREVPCPRPREPRFRLARIDSQRCRLCSPSIWRLVVFGIGTSFAATR